MLDIPKQSKDGLNQLAQDIKARYNHTEPQQILEPVPISLVNVIKALIFVTICGFFAGIGGAALSLPLKTFVGGMTNGRGWIALVAVVLGRGNPVGVLIASVIFGAASALSNLFQATTDISPKLLLTVPFLVTLAVMIFYSAKRKNVNA